MARTVKIKGMHLRLLLNDNQYAEVTSHWRIAQMRWCLTCKHPYRFCPCVHKRDIDMPLMKIVE